jgi:hypothetical protein
MVHLSNRDLAQLRFHFEMLQLVLAFKVKLLVKVLILLSFLFHLLLKCLQLQFKLVLEQFAGSVLRCLRLFYLGDPVV